MEVAVVGRVMDNLIISQIKGHFGQEYKGTALSLSFSLTVRVRLRSAWPSVARLQGKRGDPEVWWDVDGMCASEPSMEGTTRNLDLQSESRSGVLGLLNRSL